jgi:hypothetical protein
MRRQQYSTNKRWLKLERHHAHKSKETIDEDYLPGY